MSKRMRLKTVAVLLLASLSAGTVTAKQPDMRLIRQVTEQNDTSRPVLRSIEVTRGVLTADLCDIAPNLVPEWPFDAKLAAKMVLGARSAIFRQALLDGRYSATFVRNALTTYEARGAERIEAQPETVFDGLNEKALSDVVNARRQNAQEGRYDVKLDQRECGGTSALPVATFIIRPTRGRVALLPEFFGLLCSAKRVDRFDEAKCTGWAQVMDGTKVGVSGRYLYKASWGDRKARTGVLLLERTAPVRFEQ